MSSDSEEEVENVSQPEVDPSVAAQTLKDKTVRELESLLGSECKKVKEAFNAADEDSSGAIDPDEFQKLLQSVSARSITTIRIRRILKMVDLDNSGSVSWKEFLIFWQLKDYFHSTFHTSTGGKQHAKPEEAKGTEVIKGTERDALFGSLDTRHVELTAGTGGSVRVYPIEERVAFSNYVNTVLHDDPSCAYLLPIDPDTHDLFEKGTDGILYCKLVNWASPGFIDERSLNFPKEGSKLSVFRAAENVNVAIDASRGINCHIVNIGYKDLIDGTPALVLGLVWQIIKIGLLSKVSLKHHPFLVVLLEEDETLKSFWALPPEAVLLRWIAYHLKAGGCNRVVNNFSSDLSDSVALTHLLNQVSKGKCSLDPLKERDDTKRAEKLLAEADKIHCRHFVSSAEIVGQKEKLVMGFVAEIFNRYPCLEPPKDTALLEGLDTLEDDEAASREERTFRIWMNSLPVDPLVVDFFGDMTNGIILLQCIDKVKPGIVDWKKVTTKPSKMKQTQRFEHLHNLSYALELGKELRFSVVNIGNEDIYHKNKKLTLAFVWQIMRGFMFRYLSDLSGGGAPVDEETLITWCNDTTDRDAPDITSFKDRKVLGSSSYWVHLLHNVAPESVDIDLVQTDDTEEAKKSNAKYAISVARKIGANVFCIWEDLAETNAKMLLCFVAAVAAAKKKRRAQLTELSQREETLAKEDKKPKEDD